MVLDPSQAGGASVEERPEYQIQGCGPAREKARILFPRSCINQKLEKFNRVSALTVADGFIRVETGERDSDGRALVIYKLDRNLRVVDVGFSDRLRNLHRELQSAGRLDHALSDREIEEMRNLRFLPGGGEKQVSVIPARRRQPGPPGPANPL